MSRPHLSIELAGYGSLVRGYKAREIVEEVTSRPPVWMSRLRGWSVQERTARDVVAVAERRGYDITVIGPVRAVPTAPTSPVEDASPDEPESGLW